MMTKISPFSENDCGDSVVYELFSLTILLFQVAGCYTGGGISWCRGKNTQTLSRRIWLHFHKSYCISITLCIMLTSTIYVYDMSQHESLSSQWFKIFSFTAISITCVWMITSSSVNFRNRRLQSWIVNFSHYGSSYGLSIRFNQLKRHVKWTQRFTLALLFLSCLTLTVSVFVWPEIGEVLLVNTIPRWFNYVLLIINLYIFAVALFSIMSCFFVGSFCFLYEFGKLGTRVQEYCNKWKRPQKPILESRDVHIQIEHFSEESRFADFYDQHQQICELFRGFNSSIQHLLLIMFFVSLPMACVMVYYLLTQKESSLDEIIAVAVLLLCFLPWTSTCLVGSLVNLKAHEPLQYLWKIPPSAVNEKTARELLMFTTKLTGPSIGYSVYNLFTITLPASLTIAGTLLTYFIVVIQFKPSDCEPCTHSQDQNLLGNLTSLIHTAYNSSCGRG